MKQVFIYLSISGSLFVLACNNGGEHHQHNPATEAPATREDSLYKDIMDAHDVAMPKMGKLRGYISLAKQQLDSVSKLPAKELAAAAAYKASLDSVLESLQYADMAMDTWMTEFVPDSMSDDLEKRIQYLESEKMKASKMKVNVLGSLEKAKEFFKQ